MASEPPLAMLSHSEVVAPSGIVVPANASPLEFLQAVYRDPMQPMALRVRAAVEAAPVQHPKLSTTYDMSGAIGRQLEARLARLEGQTEAD